MCVLQRHTVRAMNYLTALFFAADAVMKMIAQGVLFTPTAYFQVLPTDAGSPSEGLAAVPTFEGQAMGQSGRLEEWKPQTRTRPQPSCSQPILAAMASRNSQGTAQPPFPP